MNGTKVANWTDTNDPYTKGYLAIHAATDPGAQITTEAEFDDFVVAKL
jgi:hypothetical protein